MAESAWPEFLRPLYPVLVFPVDWIVALADNADGLAWAKILFLMLPAALLLVGLWLTVASLVTVIVRPDRTKFVATVLILWWDGGRAILLYWAGIFRFLFYSIGWVFGATRLVVLGTVQTIKDILFLPLTIVVHMAKNYSSPGIPWIAVMITLVWITLESIIFTTLLNESMQEIVENMARVEIPTVLFFSGLYIFIFLLIGGSMACMHGLVKAIESKNYFNIAKMVFFELIVMVGEVMFFFQELIRYILHIFSQMSGSDIQLGASSIFILGMLGWIGVRSATWFLFGKYGTPTLLNIISREGIQPGEGGEGQVISLTRPLSWVKNLVNELQGEINWFNAKGIEIIEYFVIPPTQILAVMTNFIMMFLTSKTLFTLPLKSLSELKNTKEMIQQISDEKRAKGAGD